MRSLRPDITTLQDLAADALSFTTTIGRRFRLEQIIFRADVAITETITITLDSGKGADYDTVLRVKTLSNEQNYVFVPSGDNDFYAGDEIKIECTNANLTGTIRCIIKTREILI